MPKTNKGLRGLSGLREIFDPESDGYDFDSAKAAGLGPDKTGHWPSRDPKTGLLLKGFNHKTFHKTIDGERKAGFEIIKGKDGRYYSFKKTDLPR